MFGAKLLKNAAKLATDWRLLCLILVVIYPDIV